MINKRIIVESFVADEKSSISFESLNVLIDSINKEAELTFFGEKAASYQIKQHLRNRHLIASEFKDLNTQKISSPIIVIGLPRSGTTFLFNLLAKDKLNRSPLFWEMMNPLPLAKPNSIREKYRVLRSDAILYFKEKYIPNLDDLHKIRSISPEECLLIKVFALQSIMYFYMANTPTYLEYLKGSDTSESYIWHSRFLRILEETRKPERWLLKDPSHLGNLDEILGIYPEAKFIHITRDPSETLPSICSLTHQVRRGFSNTINLNELGQQTLDFWSASNDKNEKQKAYLTSQKYFTVQYRDLIEDPINLIKDIYRNFKFHLNEDTLMSMESYIETGKKEAKAKHKYTLEDYGLTREEVHNKLNFD